MSVWSRLPWPRPGLRRDVLALMTGTGLAQLILFLVSPILTRLYPPVEFGQYAVFMRVLGVAAVLATGRYAFAVVVEKDDARAARLVGLSFAITIVLSLLALGAVAAADVLDLPAGAGEDLVRLFYLLPLLLFLRGLHEALYQWWCRRERFARVSRSNAFAAVATAAASIGLGLVGAGALGLVAGRIAGMAAAVGVLAAGLGRRLFAPLRAATREDLRALARRYRRFPQFDVPNAFVQATIGGALLVVLGSVYGAAAAGNYALAELLISAPAVLVSNAVAQVFFRRLSKAAHDPGGTRTAGAETAIARFLLWITVPFFLVAWAARYYLPPLVGAKWPELHLYFYVVAPTIYLRLVFSPLSYGLKIVDRQHVSLALHVAQLVAVLAALVAGARVLGFGPVAALLLVSATMAVMFAVNAAVVMTSLGLRRKGLVAGALAVVAVVYGALWAGGEIG